MEEEPPAPAGHDATPEGVQGDLDAPLEPQSQDTTATVFDSVEPGGGMHAADGGALAPAPAPLDAAPEDAPGLGAAPDHRADDAPQPAATPPTPIERPSADDGPAAEAPPMAKQASAASATGVAPLHADSSAAGLSCDAASAGGPEDARPVAEAAEDEGPAEADAADALDAGAEAGAEEPAPAGDRAGSPRPSSAGPQPAVAPAESAAPLPAAGGVQGGDGPAEGGSDGEEALSPLAAATGGSPGARASSGGGGDESGDEGADLVGELAGEGALKGPGRLPPPGATAPLRAVRGKGGALRLTFSRPPYVPKAAPHRRADYSHSNVRLMKIGHDNELLVNRLTEIAGAEPAWRKGLRSAGNTASAAVNRRRAAGTIAAQNLQLYSRLVAIRPSADISRATLAAAAAEADKYRANCSQFKPAGAGAAARAGSPAGRH